MQSRYIIQKNILTMNSFEYVTCFSDTILRVMDSYIFQDNCLCTPNVCVSKI